MNVARRKDGVFSLKLTAVLQQSNNSKTSLIVSLQMEKTAAFIGGL